MPCSCLYPKNNTSCLFYKQQQEQVKYHSMLLYTIIDNLRNCGIRKRDGRIWETNVRMYSTTNEGQEILKSKRI